MTGWQLLREGWDWEPSVLIGSALIETGYLASVRFRVSRATLLFTSGVVVTIVALVSPLDALADSYLFSAHMLQHILLDLVAPPLFVLGCSEGLARRIVSWRVADRAERILSYPALAWFLGIGTLWIWHLPRLYDATLENEQVHIFEHVTFLVTGTILWWPVFTSLAERRLQPLIAVVYLVLAAFANGVLGIIFTLATTPFYYPYQHPEDPLGALALIRGRWGLTEIADQQLGGAIMWVLGSVIFLWAIMVLMSRWYAEEKSTT